MYDWEHCKTKKIKNKELEAKKLKNITKIKWQKNKKLKKWINIKVKKAVKLEKLKELKNKINEKRWKNKKNNKNYIIETTEKWKKIFDFWFEVFDQKLLMIVYIIFILLESNEIKCQNRANRRINVMFLIKNSRWKMIMNNFGILCQNVDMNMLHIHDLEFFHGRKKYSNFFFERFHVD